MDRVSRVAGALSTLNVGRGDRVAILAQNTDRYLELMYAIAWIGAVFVPIDTGLGASRIRHILADAGAVTLFIDGTMAHHLRDLDGNVGSLREVLWIDDIASPEGMLHYEDLTASEPVLDSGAGDGDLAGLFYDGPAQQGPGAALTHAQMLANARDAVKFNNFDGGTVYLHASPMFELAEDALTFAVTLAGGRHVFVPRFEPGEVLQIIAVDKVTHAQLVPEMIEKLLAHPRFGEFDVSSLRAVLHGTRPLPDGLLKRTHDMLPHVSFLDGQGRYSS